MVLFYPPDTLKHVKEYSLPDTIPLGKVTMQEEKRKFRQKIKEYSLPDTIPLGKVTMQEEKRKFRQKGYSAVIFFLVFL